MILKTLFKFKLIIAVKFSKNQQAQQRVGILLVLLT